MQHTMLPCPSLSPGLCSDLRPLSRWWHPTISSSVTCFSSCPQSFPASGSFPMSLFFTSGGQSIAASASASVLPMRIQGWLPLVLTGLISLLPKRLSRVFSRTTVEKHQFFGAQSYDPILTPLHDNWKTPKFDYTDHVGKVMSLLFNILSRFVMAFLSRNQRLLISWLQSPSAVILEPKKIKSVTVSAFCHKVMDQTPWSCSIPQPLVLKKLKWNSSVKTYKNLILMSV